MIDRSVARDPEEPRCEWDAPLAIAREPLRHFEEDLLRQVGGLVSAIAACPHEAIDARDVALIELSQCGGIAQRPAHQLGVIACDRGAAVRKGHAGVHRLALPQDSTEVSTSVGE